MVVEDFFIWNLILFYFDCEPCCDPWNGSPRNASDQVPSPTPLHVFGLSISTFQTKCSDPDLPLALFLLLLLAYVHSVLIL